MNRYLTTKFGGILLSCFLATMMIITNVRRAPEPPTLWSSICNSKLV